MLKFVIIIVAVPQRHWSYRSKSVLLAEFCPNGKS
jgi:hypothetical protein